MDAFRTRVSAYLLGGAQYEADRGYRAGLFAALQNSLFYEFCLTRTNAGTRVIIAGGDKCHREFVLEFGLEVDGLKREIAKADVVKDDITAYFHDYTDLVEMTRTSAMLMYNMAARRAEQDH